MTGCTVKDITWEQQIEEIHWPVYGGSAGSFDALQPLSASLSLNLHVFPSPEALYSLLDSQAFEMCVF